MPPDYETALNFPFKGKAVLHNFGINTWFSQQQCDNFKKTSNFVLKQHIFHVKQKLEKT